MAQKTLEQAKTEYELEVIAKMTAETQKLVKDVLGTLDLIRDKAQSNRGFLRHKLN